MILRFDTLLAPNTRRLEGGMSGFSSGKMGLERWLALGHAGSDALRLAAASIRNRAEVLACPLVLCFKLGLKKMAGLPQ